MMHNLKVLSPNCQRKSIVLELTESMVCKAAAAGETRANSSKVMTLFHASTSKQYRREIMHVIQNISAPE